MSSEARLTRSAMRTRASRGVAADFVELPATPSRTRAAGKTPGKTPSVLRQPFDDISTGKVSNGVNDVCQTPAAKDVSALSDLERLLLSPTPRLTPETTKAQDVQRVADEASAKAAAAVHASKPVTTTAVTAAQTAATDAPSVQAAEAKVALSEAAAQRLAEQQASAASAAAAEQRLAADLQAAADAQAAAEVAAAAERNTAARVAAEVQAAADAALIAAQLQAAEAQSAALQAAAVHEAPVDTDELPATVDPTQAPTQAGSERWDVDADDDTMCDSDDAANQQQLMDIVPPRSVIKSKIVPAASFEPRSIRQLKKDIKAQYVKQTTVSGLAEDGDDVTEEECMPSEDGAKAAMSLADVLGGLSIGAGGAAGPLRGVPVAQGKHLRFDDDGNAEVGSPVELQLRGMPPAGGKHLRFD